VPHHQQAGASSAAGDGGDDRHRLAVGDLGRQAVEVAHVVIVHEHVHVLPNPAVVEQLRPEPDVLTIWQETMQIPCVAIGGITVDNAAPLIAAGADFIAVCSGVWNYDEGPAAAVKAFNGLF